MRKLLSPLVISAQTTTRWAAFLVFTSEPGTVSGGLYPREKRAKKVKMLGQRSSPAPWPSAARAAWRSPRCQRRIRDVGLGHSQFIDRLSTFDYVLTGESFPAKSSTPEKGIAMILKKIVGAGAIASAIGFSAIGLAGVANAAPTPQAAPGVVHQAQSAGWGGGRGGGWHGGGGGWHGGRGWGGPGWGGGRGWGGPPPPCLLGLCI
jgi:hypothetical protein